MLNNMQRAILKAHGKAKMSLKSHLVIGYDYSINHPDNREDVGYLVISCEDSWRHNKHINDIDIAWMHPNITPCWEDYDITEEDYTSYMRRRFPLLVN